MTFRKCRRDGCHNSAADDWIYCSLKCQEAARADGDAKAFGERIAAKVADAIKAGAVIVQDGEALGFPPASRMELSADGSPGGLREGTSQREPMDGPRTSSGSYHFSDPPRRSRDCHVTSWIDKNGQPPRYPYKGPPGD